MYIHIMESIDHVKKYVLTCFDHGTCVFNIGCLHFEMFWTSCDVAEPHITLSCQLSGCTTLLLAVPAATWQHPKKNRPLTCQIRGHGRTIKGALAVAGFQRPSIGEVLLPSASVPIYYSASVLLCDSMLRTSMPAPSIGTATRRVLHVLP